MFFVIQETTCSKCEGIGIFQAPIWASYWEWERKFRTEFARLPNREEERNWWADRGLYENATYPQDVIPPEECECPFCGGGGIISKKVELSAAQDLKACLLEITGGNR